MPLLSDLDVPSHLHVQLRNGSRLVLRPIRPDDRDRLSSGMHDLSPQTRRLRFLSPIEELSDETLDRLTNVDPGQHVAWGALDPSRPDEPGAGVARAIADEESPSTVELAITIADAHQGAGLGVVLLAAVLLVARATGFERFEAEVLAENERMLALLAQIHATTEPPSGRALTLTGPLPDDLDRLPPDPMRGVLEQLRDHVAAGADGLLRIADHGSPPTKARPPLSSGSVDLDEWLDSRLGES